MMAREAAPWLLGVGGEIGQFSWSEVHDIR